MALVEHVSPQQHARELNEYNKTRHAANEALRGLDELATKTKKFSDVHTLLHTLHEEEKQLFVELPNKLGKTKLKSPQTNFVIESSHRSKRLTIHEDTGASPTSPKFEFDETPPRKRKSIMMIEAGGASRAIPKLPCRNVIPPSDIFPPGASPSKYMNYKEPAENRKETVEQERRAKVEKMLVKPGHKHPPRANFVPPPLNIKKVNGDWVPEVADKRPAHWPEPEPAHVHVSPPVFRFTSSPTNGTQSPARNARSEDAQDETGDEPADE